MPEIVNTEKCVGCRSCEIACSYHHKKIFSREISSIKVLRWEREGKFGIVLHLLSDDGRLACDGCKFCLNFCPEIARDELKAIIEGKTVRVKGEFKQ